MPVKETAQSKKNCTSNEFFLSEFEDARGRLFLTISNIMPLERAGSAENVERVRVNRATELVRDLIDNDVRGIYRSNLNWSTTMLRIYWSQGIGSST